MKKYVGKNDVIVLIDSNFKKYIVDITSKTDKIKILSVVSWYTNCKGPDLLHRTIKKLKENNNNYYFTLLSREKKPYSEIFDLFYSDLPKSKIANLYKKNDILIFN